LKQICYPQTSKTDYCLYQHKQSCIPLLAEWSNIPPEPVCNCLVKLSLLLFVQTQTDTQHHFDHPSHAGREWLYFLLHQIYLDTQHTLAKI